MVRHETAASLFHPALQTKQSVPVFNELSRLPLQPAAIPDPAGGRTNIPMHLPPGSLPPGSYAGLAGSSVALTPLSPPQHSSDGLVTGIEVPYPTHPQSFPHGAYHHPHHQHEGVSLPTGDAVLSQLSKGYASYPQQNGSLPQQTFFGASRLFSESELPPQFHFKLGGNSANLFHLPPSLVGDVTQREQGRHLQQQQQQHHEPSHRDDKMGMVVQR